MSGARVARGFPSGLKFWKKQNQNGVSRCSRGVIALIVSQPGCRPGETSSTSNTSVVKTSTLCRVASEVWGRSCGS